LARAGFQVTAVDISPVAIAILKKWAQEEDLSIVIRLNTLQKFRPKRVYDAVICNSVLDHLPHEDAVKVMAKIRTLLKTTGVAYISFDGLEKEEKKEYRLLGDGTRFFIKGRYENMVWRYYTDDEIKGLLNGLIILQYRIQKNGKRSIWLKKGKLGSTGFGW
jgi:SAM-dependent methyltransferase